MEANVQYQVMDWKDSPDMKLLHKAIKEIEALGHGSQVVEEHSPICDSKVVLVMPADVNYRGITEDTSDVLCYCDKMHIDKDGKFHFTFHEDCNMPATSWMDEDKAAIWVNGMACSDELTHGLSDEKEIKEFTKAKQDALDLL